MNKREKQKAEKTAVTGAGALVGIGAAARSNTFSKSARSASRSMIRASKTLEKSPARKKSLKVARVKVAKSYGILGAGAAVGAAAGYGGYKAYKHFKNDPKSPANARGQVSDVRGNSRVGKKSSQPFYYRTVKGKKQRVKKGKR